MREPGVPVDHSTINRWVVTYRPQLIEFTIEDGRGTTVSLFLPFTE
jgi:transposase-like protein